MTAFKKMKGWQYIVYSSAILLGIFLDLLSKWLVVKLLKPIDDFPLWDVVFHLNYHENRGAAFGILQNSRWVFLLISTVAIIAVLVYLFSGRSENKLSNIAFCLIISGGIGNMVDRLALGYVIDFLYFKLINFAIFNIADSLVCIGAGLLILSLVIDIVKEARVEKGRKEK
jgi:signal peptidase II